MEDNTFELLETINGKWVKVGPGIRKGAFALEMGENVLLTMHVYNKNIAFHTKDEHDTYQYLGDISFESENTSELTFRMFSTSAANMTIGKDFLTNVFADTTDLTVNFSTKQRQLWKDNIDF
jgi:hypothetical protein